MGRIQLQASWSAGQVVVWAGGPRHHARPRNDELADRLEAIGGPAARLEPAPGRACCRRARGPRRWPSRSRSRSAGWSRSAAALRSRRRRRRAWRGSAGSRSAASGWWPHGAVVADPAHQPRGRRPGRRRSSVRWAPALVDEAELDRLAAGDARRRRRPRPGRRRGPTTLAVLGAVVDAIVERGRRPPRAAGAAARRPHRRRRWPRRSSTRLDGSHLRGPGRRRRPRWPKRLERWADPVTAPRRPRLVVQLDPPDAGDAWFLSVLGPGADGHAAADRGGAGRQQGAPSRWPTSWSGSSACCPVLHRPGAHAPGPGVPEPGRGVGADDRHRRRRSRPPASTSGCRRCRGASRRPALRLFAEPAGDSVVGAHQLSNVRWSVVFDDVELTAADIARLAAEARPLVQSRGRWVELDRVDLKEAAAALAERADDRRSSPAPRSCATRVGLEGIAARPAASRSRAAAGPPTCSSKAAGRRTEPGHRARGLRRRAAQLPGRGAGLARLPRRRRARRLPRPRHGPRQDADRARPPRPHRRATGPALVIAPPAVVGNWAAEAARFTPEPAGRRPPRRRPGRRPTSSQAEVAGADVVITTYGTAVRDVDALAAAHVGPARPRRGPGHQEPGQRDRPAAAPHPGPHPARAHRHADRERPRRPVGDPRLHQPRPRRLPPGVHRPAVRATARPRCGRSTGSSCSAAPRAEPEVAAELPDRIDELDHCTMTPEQIGLYQAVLDELVADTGRAPAREPQAGRDPRRHHRAQADLQPPGRLPGRRPAARRPLRQAGPARGDRRVGVRRRRADPRLHPLRRVGPAAGRPPHRGHRRARSPATTAASPAAPATAWSPSSRTARARARSCCR